MLIWLVKRVQLPKSWSNAVQGLPFELLLSLQLNEQQSWTGRGFRNPCGVAVVVLLRLEIGTNIGR